MTRRQSGFTIVELLIVIVVIGILAAITIVAFNGVQDRAKTASVQSSVSQATKKVLAYAAQNSDQYPAALLDADVKPGTNGVTYQFTSDNTVSPRVFCVTATSGTISYYMSNKNDGIKTGICPGHNLVVWDKSQGTASMPISSVALDSTVFHTSTASMRVAPGLLGIGLKGGPFPGTVGQVYTVGLWILSDSNWNGDSGNSKIRIADSQGTYITACGYNGVKITWIYVSCSYTMTAAIPQIIVTFGNNGTVGNIWIDDLSLTRSE